jgi:2-keto-3-deoxy-L-rhamnonate aldolase RhmA
MLDFGASGVLIPRISSSAEAASIVGAPRYEVARGVSPLARSARFGIEADGDWRARADAAIGCIVQIERTGALEEVDEIASLENVDALLVGPSDLANDIGCKADLNTDPLRSEALRVIDTAVRHGKTAGLHLGRGDDPEPWAKNGVTLLSSSFESAVLLSASQEVNRRLEDAFASMRNSL